MFWMSREETIAYGEEVTPQTEKLALREYKPHGLRLSAYSYLPACL